MFAAPVWHYWIGVVVAVLTIVVFVALVGSYLRKTQAPRYPGSRQR
jgi:hypothetical protein